VNALEHDAAGTVAYGTSAGYPRLLEWIAKKHDVAPDRLIATNGSMQADAFLFQVLVEPGDLVVVEAPTYDRTLLSLRQLGAEILAIPLEPDGIDVAALELALKEGARPKLAHIIPNFQNPAGCTLSLEKRERLLALAAEYGFTIFEDDPYVELRFEGESLPTMLSMGVVLLEDGLPRHPRGLPGRPRGPHRPHPEARHEHLHLAEHGGPVDRRGVLPLGRDRALDRNGQGGPSRAPRRDRRGSEAPHP
jgi:DNA-binding transcriptional MocR family regulator